MDLREAVRQGAIWTAGIAVLLLVGGGLIYGSWWLMADMFKPPAPPAKPVHIVIGLDLSQGNPLVISDIFSGKAGRRVADMIGGLPMRSKVTLRTFGTYSVNANPLQFDRVVSRRNPAAQVRRVVQGLITGVPKLVADGRLKAQLHSNIVPFLLNMAEIIDCAGTETIIVLITDGLEESEIARLNGANATLPPLATPVFEGCRRLEMLGLGQGLASITETQRLRQIWQDWATQAGFQSFRGLNDW
jgi:hypothetical protein